MSRGDLEWIGGWRPVPHAEDKGLMERIVAEGGLSYRTHGVGYLYNRRSGGHTWDPGLGYFLRRSGPQWRGLLRHQEFGTDLPVSGGRTSTTEPAPRSHPGAGG
jgi:hypothetical protein